MEPCASRAAAPRLGRIPRSRGRGRVSSYRTCRPCRRARRSAPPQASGTCPALRRLTEPKTSNRPSRSNRCRNCNSRARARSPSPAPRSACRNHRTCTRRSAYIHSTSTPARSLAPERSLPPAALPAGSTPRFPCPRRGLGPRGALDSDRLREPRPRRGSRPLRQHRGSRLGSGSAPAARREGYRRGSRPSSPRGWRTPRAAAVHCRSAANGRETARQREPPAGTPASERAGRILSCRRTRTARRRPPRHGADRPATRD